jgi:hypothetical protein
MAPELPKRAVIQKGRHAVATAIVRPAALATWNWRAGWRTLNGCDREYG